MKHIILLALSIFLFAGCGPSLETLATQTTDAETVITATPTEFLPTLTPTPTLEPTPEIPRPAVSPNLAPINNASMAYENGTWVTKNTAGKITATYTETGWKYNNDNITVEVIGWASTLPFELTRDKHPECFIKPEANASLDFVSNGQPVPDGFLKDFTESYTDGSSTTFAWFVARYVGSFIDADYTVGRQPSMVVCIRVGDALVPVVINTNDYGTQMYFIQENDPLQPIVYGGQTGRKMQTTFNSLPVGRQIVITTPYSVPSDNPYANLNDTFKQIIDALKKPIRAEGSRLDIERLPIGFGIPEELIRK